MFVYTVQLHPGKKGLVFMYCAVCAWLAKMKKSQVKLFEPIGRIRKAPTYGTIEFLGMDDDTAWYTGYRCLQATGYRCLQATCRLQIPLS